MDSNIGIPKYITVRDHLRQRLTSMQAGEQLPTEAELCTQYNVSRITIRRAVDDLIRDGALVRKQGSGTFKTRDDPSTGEVLSEHIRGFFRQQSDLGRKVYTKVLQNHLINDALIAAKLDLHDDADIIELERLRYVNDELQQHVATYLPAQRFSAVLEHDFSHGSLYEFIEQSYAIELSRNEVVVRIEKADPAVASFFGIPSESSVLAMDSTVFDTFGSTIAFGTALHPPEHSEVRFIITNRS
ncbi:GntR family transcriptional regulator [Bifidobacterium aquikefiri]|uniref:GntR family transcriptional regulator n=1 Tax=Bifidobacterium aquikefiri TaxID=1653207 RepID=A0A261G808_9BIFI|nr:GntR family transcriptional regulator [Bifidobacterium aquikefiri]OZG67567.1 GntR family transcriptional regulator [Bifidobacterium aquikefiri]